MRKLLLIISIILLSINSFGQTRASTSGFSPRANQTFVVEDGNLSARNSLFTPRFSDTTTAMTYILKDTVGNVVFIEASQSLWVRTLDGNGGKKWTEIGSGGGGGGTWGSITGTLSDQTDLQTALDLKSPLASPTFTGTVTFPTPFTLGATSVTATGTQLNYLNAATGVTGTASTNIVFSTSPLFVTPRLNSTSTTGYVWTATDASGNGSFQAIPIANNTNAGAFYRLLKPTSQEIKTAAEGYGVLIDSTSNTDALTFKVDTTSASGLVSKDRLTAEIALIDTANLIVQDLGATGTPVASPRNDTLYIRKIVAGENVTIDTLSTGEIEISSPSNIEEVSADAAMTGNIAINTTLNRLTYKLGTWYYHVAITDSVGVFSDADVIAFINRWEIAAGATIPLADAEAINALILSLKADDVYDDLTEFYLFYGASAATHALGFKNAFNLTFSGSPTHSATGTAFNGSNQYATTGMTPSTTMTLNNSHISFYSRSAGTRTASIMGAFSSSSSAIIMNNNNTTLGFTSDQYGSSARISVANASGLGFYTSTRVSSTDFRLFKNGTQQGSTLASTSGSRPSVPMFIGGWNNNGTPQFADVECAFASFGIGLTPTKATAFNTAVEAFQDALSRGVE